MNNPIKGRSFNPDFRTQNKAYEAMNVIKNIKKTEMVKSDPLKNESLPTVKKPLQKCLSGINSICSLDQSDTFEE